MAPTHSPALPRIRNLSFNLLINRELLHLLSALAQTLMLLCSGRPVSFKSTRILKSRCLQSALAQTYMLHSISQPVSSSQILTGLDHLHQGALVQTLVQNLSRPASLCPTNNLQTLIFLSPDKLQPAEHPPTDLQLTDLTPTDWVPLLLPAQIHLFCKLVEDTVFTPQPLRAGNSLSGLYLRNRKV